jgi:hypothetical protein
VAESWRQWNQAADESSGPRINLFNFCHVTSERASEAERVKSSPVSLYGSRKHGNVFFSHTVTNTYVRLN